MKASITNILFPLSPHSPRQSSVFNVHPFAEQTLLPRVTETVICFSFTGSFEAQQTSFIYIEAHNRVKWIVVSCHRVW